MDGCAILATGVQERASDGRDYFILQQAQIVVRTEADALMVRDALDRFLASQGVVRYDDLFSILGLARPYNCEPYGWKDLDLSMTEGYYNWSRYTPPHKEPAHIKKNQCWFITFPEQVKIDE